MCGSLGICYRRLGDLDSSLFYYKKGLETAIESQNTEYEIYLNNCISVLFNEQRDTVKPSNTPTRQKQGDSHQ